MNTFYHGTTDPDTDFKYIDGSLYVAYFSDSESMAKHFALKEDEGGLQENETATVISVKLNINNPIEISEDDWEESGDICYIDKKGLMERGFDGILCTNSSNCTYAVAFSTDQIEIISKTYLT